MDLSGLIIVLVGLWAVTAPFVLYFAIKRRRWVIAALYALPIVWQSVGYVVAKIS